MHRHLAVVAALLLPTWSFGTAPAHLRATVALSSIHMITVTTGWAVGSGRKPGILRTTDGGRDWSEVLAAGAPAPAAAFVDGQSARMAVTRSFGDRTIRIYRTEDAGAHWMQSAVTVPVMSTGSVLQLDFPTRRQGWLLAGVTPGMGHLVYSLWHSSDGGAHWTMVAYDLESRRSTGAFPGCNCLSGINTGITFLGSGTGWVTGEPFATPPPWIYVTHNAGRRWSAQPLPRTWGRVIQVTHAPAFVGARTGYLPVELSPPGAPRVIVDAYVTRDSGRTWTPTSSVSGQEPMGKYVGGLSYSFLEDGQGWMAVHGYFWHTSDGGRHWQRLHPAGWPNDVSQLQLLNRSLGFALPAGLSTTYLLRTRDGGHTWQRILPRIPSLTRHGDGDSKSERVPA